MKRSTWENWRVIVLGRGASVCVFMWAAALMAVLPGTVRGTGESALSIAAADIGDGRVLVSWDWAGGGEGFIIEREPAMPRGAVELGPEARSLVDLAGDGEFSYRARVRGDEAAVSRWTAVAVTSSGTARELQRAEGERILRGIEIGEDGWAVLRPGAGSRVVYVSSSEGSDENDGLSASAPKRSIRAGYAMLRDGHPDWLLLKRGDVWQEGQVWWAKSGRSPSERMVVAAYGEGPRPVWRTGRESGIAGDPSRGGRCANLAFMDLHLVQDANDGTLGGSGFLLLNGWRDVLIENCRVENYRVNMCFQAFADGVFQHNIAVRRNIIIDSISTTDAHSQGIFADGVDGLLLEENLLDQNAWSPEVPTANIFRHNVYIQTQVGDDKGCRNVVSRGNISARASATGIMQRAGGVVEENLFLANPIAVYFGYRVGPAASGIVQDNVILDARDIASGEPRGYGVWVTSARGAEVAGNIIAHQRGGTYNAAGINVDGVYENVVVRDNIVYDWTHGNGKGGEALSWFGTALGGMRVEGNVFQQVSGGHLLRHQAGPGEAFTYRDNTYYSREARDEIWPGVSLESWVRRSGETGASFRKAAFPDPERTIASYMKHIGMSGGLEEFLDEARQQDREGWREAFTAAAVIEYVREGFGVQAAGEEQ